MSEYNIQMNKYNALNAGYDQLYPQPMKHANTHAEDGNDPITPSMIGTYNKTEIDTALQKKVNPNLLDNWYFGNPVNQRGKTKYGGGNYSIDRWTVSSANTGAKIAVASDGIILTATTDKPAQFIQGLEIPLSKSLVGKKVTLSALVSEVSGGVGVSLARSKTAMYNENGVGSGSPIVSKSGIVTITVTIPDVLTENQFFNATLTCRAGSSGKIVAMKLELGTQQTLAHQENGNWVLNEIPDYGEQLARCQRYQFVPQIPTWNSYQFTFMSESLVGIIPFPVTMRTIPSVVLTGKQLRNNSKGQVLTLDVVGSAFKTVDALTYMYGVSSSDGTFVEGDQYSFLDQIIFDANL